MWNTSLSSALNSSVLKVGFMYSFVARYIAKFIAFGIGLKVDCSGMAAVIPSEYSQIDFWICLI